MPLDNAPLIYRPMNYPWAFEFWKRQHQMHWLPWEVPLTADVKDYNKLDAKSRAVIDNIFRFFVQSDVEVQDCYHQKYQPIFKPVEVKMMLSAFADMETVHIAAYAHLLDTLGIPESEYSAFTKYKEMRDKSDFFHSFNPTDAFSVAETLAGVSGLGEGLYLFASFAILLNYPRQNLLKGMGQIVSWSVRDESLHCEGVMKLFHTWLAEHPEIDRALLRSRVEAMTRDAVRIEDAFIDLVFEAGDIPGLTREEIKSHVRAIANMRLRQLGYWDIFDMAEELPWFNAMVASPEHANFFETRSTEYSKAATKGDWGDAY